MRDLLDEKQGKKKKREKEEREITDNMIGQKRRENCTLCRSVFWRS